MRTFCLPLSTPIIIIISTTTSTSTFSKPPLILIPGSSSHSYHAYHAYHHLKPFHLNIRILKINRNFSKVHFLCFFLSIFFIIIQPYLYHHLHTFQNIHGDDEEKKKNWFWKNDQDDISPLTLSPTLSSLSWLEMKILIMILNDYRLIMMIKSSVHRFMLNIFPWKCNFSIQSLEEKNYLFE